MENDSYFLDKQLKQYKEAISDAIIQYQLDDESRIAAARAALHNAIAEYKEEKDIQRQDYIRASIDGMLKISAVCHLISIAELKDFKKAVGIENVEVSIKISF